MRRFFAAAVAAAVVVAAFPSFAADRDTAACDNVKDWEVRIAGCTRLLNRKWSDRILGQIYLQRGQGYSRLERFDAAVADFDKAIRLLPNSADAYDGRGNANSALNRPELAIQDATRAIQLNPKLAFAFNTRANAYNKLKQFDRSITDLNTAIQLDPRQFVFYLNRSEAYGGLGRFKEALADAVKAGEINPNSAVAAFVRGSSYMHLGEFDKAIQDFDRAIKLEPHRAQYFGNRSLAYRAKGEIDRALSDLDRNIKLDGKSAIAYSNRCEVLGEKGDTDAALADCDEAIRLDPAYSSSYVNRGSLRFRKGDFDAAILDYGRAIRSNPDNAGAYAGRADAWRAKDDYDKALQDLDRAIRLNPDIASIYVTRAQVREARGDAELARADFARALALPETVMVAGPQGVTAELSGREQKTARARLKVLNESSAVPDNSSAPPAAVDPAVRRIALAIGNSDYLHASKLANPANDATLVEKSLRSLGFEVFSGRNLRHSEMHKTINDFLRASVTARLVVVFYAGHGVQIDGKNYLVPVDAKFDQGTTDVTSAMTDVDMILAGLDDKIRASIVILDACRNNPFVQKTAEAAGRSIAVRSGLAPPSGLGGGATVGAGTLLAFATAPGQVAMDGEGENSPFSLALGRHIATPGLEVQQMLTRVRAEVVAATKNQQVPWSNSSLLGEVYLTRAK